MDNVFLFDPENTRFLTSEFLKHPLMPKSPEAMRIEQRVFYRSRSVIMVVLLAALLGIAALVMVALPSLTIPQYANIFTIGYLVLWAIAAYVLVGVVIRQFAGVYDPTHDITLKDEGVVVLGEVQAIDWIKHRRMYWLTIRAHHPGVPDTTLHAVIPDSESQPQPGTSVALLYSGVWGTPFYKAEAL
jgi:hypothetical protein